MDAAELAILMSKEMETHAKIMLHRTIRDSSVRNDMIDVVAQPCVSQEQFSDVSAPCGRGNDTISDAYFQLANHTPPLSVTGSVIAPSGRITDITELFRTHTGLGHCVNHIVAD